MAIVTQFTLSCATIVSPSGGPKDITPPKLINSQPKNLSTNFEGDKLILEFDEYINLRTPEKYLLISPPLSQLPVIKLKGRSLVIKLQDTLRSNTTYNFYFGDAVADLTENNPYTNFNFAFSTGNQIDSLSLSGNVTDAYTRLPLKDILVMLYSDFSDSLPMKQIPTYVSRTTEGGRFQFNSLASGKYRAVALLDGNNDYKYNLPTEMIGFCADSIKPYYIAVPLKDTSATKKDSLIRDNHAELSLDLFPEPDSTQRILKNTLISKNRLAVFFRYPSSTPHICRALNVPDSMPWAVVEWNRSNDTLNAWLLNKPDTLKLEIASSGIVLDTIVISTTMKVIGKPKSTETITRLKYTNSAMGGRLEYGRPLFLTFSNPVKEFNAKMLILESIVEKDTTFVVPAIQFTDSIHRHLKFTYNWKSNARYTLRIPAGAFIDMYGDSCESTHVSFQMKPIDDYGSFVVKINRDEKSFPVIVQLLTEKGIAVDQRIVNGNGKADFGLLVPATYGLKAIMDTNANGRWDTGEFIKKIQPEKVLVHPKKFEVRTNWELEEIWDL
jgi:uncharacterized protein (DUF2141 family)